MKYLVVVESGPTSFGAYVPDLPGCVAVGSTREEGDHVKSVLWQGSRVEVRSEKHTYVLEASAITQEDKDGAVAVLRKMVKDGELHVPAA